MSRFRKMFRLPMSRSRIEHVVDEELQFHIEERVQEFIAAGMTRQAAEAEARSRFGNYAEYHEQTRRIDEITVTQRHRMEWLDTIRRETAHAVRSLARSRAFAAVALITLALGIGAATAIYTVLDGVLLKPLPYRNASQLVSVLHPTMAPGSSGERKWGLSSTGYFHFREHARTISDLGVYRTSTLSVAGNGHDAEEARLAQVTSTLFTTLGSKPWIGRLINDEDDRPGAPLTVAVLSYEFWRRHFGADSTVIGRRIETEVAALEIIGVTEPGLTLPKPGSFSSMSDLAGFGVDMWVPLNLKPSTRANNHPFSGIARLAPGATVDDAQRELSAMTAQFAELYPDVYSKRFMEGYRFRASVIPLLDEVLGPTTAKTLWLVFAAAGLVLIIAAANVANLFLVRMETRRREAAVRGALGADRKHLAVHYLSESLLLTMTAGIAGVLLARAGVSAILAAAPRSIPRLAAVQMTPTSVLFALGVALIAGVVFGLIPLVRSGVDVQTLREGARGMTASGRQRRTRNVLVVSQIALAFMLLVGAGLMIRSFERLRHVKPGLDPAGVLALSVSLPYRVYGTMEQAATFHREFIRRVEALPGVVAVGGAGALPLRDYGTGCSVVARENRPYAKGEPTPCVHTVPSLPGFFSALGIEVQGRAPGWADVDQKTQAVVVTRALAQRLWPGEDAIGKGINLTGPSTPWYRIVGVVPELRAGGLDQPPSEAVFLAASPLHKEQSTWGMLNDIEYVIKVSKGDGTDLIAPIRGILKELDPRIPLKNPVTMQTVMERSMARTSFIMLLLGFAAAMALILSAVGTYGVMSYLVAQRRAEIGVRMALGSPVSRVLALVVSHSIQLAAIGVAVGFVGAIAGTRVMQSMLFGVSPTDPVVLVFVPVVLVSIAALASFAPARRASKVDPVEVLRG